MNVSKIVLNDEVLIDLTGDDVSEGSVLSGVKFHKSNGAQATGTYTPQTSSGGNVSAQIIDRSITSLQFSDLSGVTNIGSYAFYDCTSLNTICIPDNVTTIGIAAFNNCSNLTTIYVNSSTPPSIDWNTFDGCPLTAIFVPVGSSGAYLESTISNWSRYADIISEMMM